MRREESEVDLEILKMGKYIPPRRVVHLGQQKIIFKHTNTANRPKRPNENVEKTFSSTTHSQT